MRDDWVYDPRYRVYHHRNGGQLAAELWHENAPPPPTVAGEQAIVSHCYACGASVLSAICSYCGTDTTRVNLFVAGSAVSQNRPTAQPVATSATTDTRSLGMRGLRRGHKT